MIEYEEFNANREVIWVQMTKQEAIRRMKVIGRHLGYTYPDDKKALEDYMDFHWAYEVKGDIG